MIRANIKKTQNVTSSSSSSGRQQLTYSQVLDIDSPEPNTAALHEIIMRIDNDFGLTAAQAGQAMARAGYAKLSTYKRLVDFIQAALWDQMVRACRGHTHWDPHTQAMTYDYSSKFSTVGSVSTHDPASTIPRPM